MKEYPKIRKYLMTIENELTEIEPRLKKSISALEKRVFAEEINQQQEAIKSGDISTVTEATSPRPLLSNKNIKKGGKVAGDFSTFVQFG